MTQASIDPGHRAGRLHWRRVAWIFAASVSAAFWIGAGQAQAQGQSLDPAAERACEALAAEATRFVGDEQLFVRMMVNDQIVEAQPARISHCAEIRVIVYDPIDAGPEPRHVTLFDVRKQAAATGNTATSTDVWRLLVPNRRDPPREMPATNCMVLPPNLAQYRIYARELGEGQLFASILEDRAAAQQLIELLSGNDPSLFFDGLNTAEVIAVLQSRLGLAVVNSRNGTFTYDVVHSGHSEDAPPCP